MGLQQEYVVVITSVGYCRFELPLHLLQCILVNANRHRFVYAIRRGVFNEPAQPVLSGKPEIAGFKLAGLPTEKSFRSAGYNVIKHMLPDKDLPFGHTF